MLHPSMRVDYHDFYTLAKQQASKTPSGVHAALLTGHLVATFNIIFQNSRALWHHICHLQTEILHLCQWAVRYFPHTVRAWLVKDYGTIVIPAGDTLISYQCKRHVTYSINWKRQINNTCYTYFPVSISPNITKYLPLSNR